MLKQTSLYIFGNNNVSPITFEIESPNTAAKSMVNEKLSSQKLFKIDQFHTH